MIYVCSYCKETLRAVPEYPGLISHSICQTCLILFFPFMWAKRRLALMKPKATRADCYDCRLRDCDSDGVPDGCLQVTGQPCIAPGKRSPWD